MNVQAPPSARPGWAWPVLLVAVLAVSTGALFARLADPAPALAKAAWRCCLAAIVLIALSRGRSLQACFRLPRADQRRLLLAGGLLAIHFGTWILSLSYTSVTSSLVLVTTTPAWTALLAPLLIKEKTSARQWQGIGLCAVGIAILAFWKPDATAGTVAVVASNSHQPTLGNFLALAGAISFSLFLINGRVIQRRVEALPYLTASYGSAAVFLLLACALFGMPVWGYSGEAYIWLVALALVPQLLGHSGYNLALRHFSAATVSITLVGEPIFGSIMAWAFLGEVPGTAEWLGGAFLLVGILRAARG